MFRSKLKDILRFLRIFVRILPAHKLRILKKSKLKKLLPKNLAFFRGNKNKDSLIVNRDFLGNIFTDRIFQEGNYSEFLEKKSRILKFTDILIQNRKFLNIFNISSRTLRVWEKNISILLTEHFKFLKNSFYIFSENRSL